MCAPFSLRCPLSSIRYIEDFGLYRRPGRVSRFLQYILLQPLPRHKPLVYTYERPETGKGYACARPRTRYFLTSNVAAAAPWRGWRPAWDWRARPSGTTRRGWG